VRRLRLVGAVVLGWWLGALGSGCRASKSSQQDSDDAGIAQPVKPRASGSNEAPRLLYLPDGGDLVQNQGQLQALPPPLLPNQPPLVSGGCPPEMVAIRGQFCIDRYEASLVDAHERALSPYYPPAHDELVHVLSVFRRVTPNGRRAPPLPLPPDYSVEAAFEPRARALPAVVPSGYMSGNMARRACENAGKRLCKPEEWIIACKGQRATKFPYGDSYAEGVCNVFRESHPAALLHGDASKNHLDPRLNLIEGQSGPLLRKTGATPACRSDWGQDAAFDMVGNLDEWVDDANGAFQGGFYARATREGCEARIAVHPPQYFDYSLGVRCCK
jgi:formylglycine-generating enzyme